MDALLRDKKNQQYLALGAMLLLAVLVVVVGLVPAVQGTLHAREVIAKSVEINASLDKKLAAISTAEKLLAEQKKNIELVDSGIPSSAKVLTFVNTVTLLASNSQVALEKLDYSGTSRNLVKSAVVAGAENKVALSFDLIGKGNYDGVLSLVSDLEKLPRLVTIKSVKVSARDVVDDTENGGEPDQNVEPSIQLILQGEFYYQP